MAAMGECARRLALAEFTWDAATAKMQTAYEMLLRRDGGSQMRPSDDRPNGQGKDAIPADAR
jgi:hypothetical protein